MNKKELLINKDDLIDWIDRPPSNNDLDLITFITTRLENFYDLQEENKKLKELCDKYEEEHSTRFNDWVFDKRENERLKERFDALLEAHKIADELETEYQERNEKAIEYIGNGNIGIPRKTRDKFIAILKGEDKDDK